MGCDTLAVWRGDFGDIMLCHLYNVGQTLRHCRSLRLQLRQGQLRPLLSHAVPGAEIWPVQEAGRS